MSNWASFYISLLTTANCWFIIATPKSFETLGDKNMKHIALDYEILLALTKWHTRDFDKNGIIHELVEKFGTPYPSHVKARTKDTDYPEILKDKWLGEIVRRQNNGDKIYTNLDNIIRLYNLIVNGKVNAWVLPTVSKEIKANPMSKDFINNFCKKVKFTNDDWEKFYNERKILATSYIQSGAIEQSGYVQMEEDYIPHSARKMAEASRLGLFLVIKRDDRYLHKFSKGDYLRSSTIIDCNNAYGLQFLANNHKYLTASPITLATFIQCENMQKVYRNPKAYCTLELSVDEDGFYIPDGKMDKVDAVRLPQKDINFELPF